MKIDPHNVFNFAACLWPFVTVPWIATWKSFVWKGSQSLEKIVGYSSNCCCCRTGENCSRNEWSINHCVILKLIGKYILGKGLFDPEFCNFEIFVRIAQKQVLLLCFWHARPWFVMGRVWKGLRGRLLALCASTYRYPSIAFGRLMPKGFFVKKSWLWVLKIT